MLNEHVEAAPQIAERLESLGVATIRDNTAHEARVEADARLRAYKEEQKRGLATGADATGPHHPTWMHREFEEECLDYKKRQSRPRDGFGIRRDRWGV